jgi:alkylated DNA repair dioxygenase AlkB
MSDHSTEKCTCCADTTAVISTVVKLKPSLRKLPLKQTKRHSTPLALDKTAAAIKTCAKGVYTITFGDVAENGIGMEQLGQMYGRGLTVQELVDAQAMFDKLGLVTELVDLTQAVTDEDLDHLRSDEGKPKAIKKKSFLPKSMTEVEAALLIVRNGVSAFIKDDAANLLKEEQQQIAYDTRKLNQYKKEVNSIARHNVCFDDFDQDINLSQGQGTVVDFSHLPLLSKIRNGLKDYIPTLADIELKAEGNYYYNRSQCGIGWHGDKERRIVIAVRLGESMDINYQWWYGHTQAGKRVNVILNHGDIYFMSDKAVGYDTGSPSKLTLRHCAGHFTNRDF